MDYRNFLAISLLMMSLEAIVNSDRRLPSAQISNARDLIVLQVSNFRAAVSKYLLINIKVHKESDDDRITSF
jgi:uncharacterized membrane protein